MQVPRKQHRRRRFPGGSENSCVRHRAKHKDHVWSYDFLNDRTEDGRQFRLLAVIDEYTRECLAIEAGRSFTAQDVIGVLQYLFAVRGTPQHIRSDNGPEFVAKAVCRWLKRAEVKTPVCRQGEPLGKRLRRVVQRHAPRRTLEPGDLPKLGGSSLGDRPLATGLQSPPHPQFVGLPDPRRLCGRLCSSGSGYACASRTQPNYQTRFSHSTWCKDRGVVRLTTRVANIPLRRVFFADCSEEFSADRRS